MRIGGANSIVATNGGKIKLIREGKVLGERVKGRMVTTHFQRDLVREKKRRKD